MTIHVATDSTAIPSIPPSDMFAARITEAWQEQVPSILEVGKLLADAKRDLHHGEWMRLVKTKLPFGQSTANRLMKIRNCDHLRNWAHGPNLLKLPACWRTLHELTKLTRAQFEAGLTSGVINARMQRKDVKPLRGEEPVPANRRPSLREQLAEQGAEIERLRRSGGDLFGPNDSARDIATVLVNTINSPRKLKQVMTEVRRLLRERGQQEQNQ
jgi:hypothetical protein